MNIKNEGLSVVEGLFWLLAIALIGSAMYANFSVEADDLSLDERRVSVDLLTSLIQEANAEDETNKRYAYAEMPQDIVNFTNLLKGAQEEIHLDEKLCYYYGYTLGESMEAKDNHFIIFTALKDQTQGPSGETWYGYSNGTGKALQNAIISSENEVKFNSLRLCDQVSRSDLNDIIRSHELNPHHPTWRWLVIPNLDMIYPL